jgi:hypothetical protein
MRRRRRLLIDKVEKIEDKFDGRGVVCHYGRELSSVVIVVRGIAHWVVIFMTTAVIVAWCVSQGRCKDDSDSRLYACELEGVSQERGPSATTGGMLSHGGLSCRTSPPPGEPRAYAVSERHCARKSSLRGNEGI